MSRICSTGVRLLAFSVPPVDAQIDNGVGQADQRASSIEPYILDHIDMDTLGGKVFTGDVGVFGGH